MLDQCFISAASILSRHVLLVFTPVMRAVLAVDQSELGDQLAAALRKIDVETVQIQDVAVAKAQIQATKPDLVISTYGISALDGLSLCREVRQGDGRHNPLILIIT